MEGQRTIANSSFAAEKRALNALIADFTSIGLGEVAGGLPHIAIIGVRAFLASDLSSCSSEEPSTTESIGGEVELRGSHFWRGFPFKLATTVAEPGMLQIRVPRDKDTCTRCPFEIRMLREDSDWSCRIKLRFDYDDSQETLKKPQACDFGALIDESAKGLVEDRLRRAQLAILNGLDSVINHQRFLDGDLDRLKREALDALAFSHNTVIVEIRGPEVTDLTFVDLPVRSLLLVSPWRSDTVNIGHCRRRASRHRRESRQQADREQLPDSAHAEHVRCEIFPRSPTFDQPDRCL